MARSKVEHLRGKPETVKLGDNEYTVKPKKNGELLDIIRDLEDKWTELWSDLKDKDIEDMNTLEFLMELIRTEPARIINQLVEEEFTEEDFMEAYPNDIYNVAVTFKEVNFTFLSSLKGPLGKIWNLLTNSPVQRVRQNQNRA